MRDTLEPLVRAALEEDIGQEDITTNTTVDEDARCSVRLLAKQDGVLSGVEAFHIAYKIMEAEVEDWEAMKNGAHFKCGDILVQFKGRTRPVLTAERISMNFIQHLSGIATLTAAFVAQLAGLNCRVCSTRKTTPLMRRLEKQAVIHGGGSNHRHSLFNGILIKENHITAAGGVAEAIRRAEEGTHHLMRVGIEVRNLEEFDEALAADAGVIMLDNMDLERMREAVRRAEGHKVVLEASGNATLDRVRAMAETGVDVISVGALTHSSPSVDLSLLIDSL